ncbi:MAG: hypothetical protein SWY16_02645 [Cyanobacteriota bacterium]|nr:hypothetical protein [Cyanobacteriota bacterium]
MPKNRFRQNSFALLLSPVALLAAFSPLPAHAEEFDANNCTFNGIPLYGEVKIVSSGADFTVEVVDSFPDLNVQVVESFPDDCGEWEFVESSPDFTIEYVDSFPDVEIEFVNSFPGTP